MYKTSTLKTKQSNRKSRVNSKNPMQQKLFTQTHTFNIQQGVTEFQDKMAQKFRSDMQKMGAKLPDFHSINKNKISNYNTIYPLRNSKTRGSQRRHEIARNQDDDFSLVSNMNQPLAQLISKAKTITSTNKQKIQKAKNEIKKQKQSTFLTGTGLYNQPQQDFQYDLDNQVNENCLLKSLIETEQSDDLAELRRMIRATDQNLNTYSNEIYYSSQNVVHAADHFKKQVDAGILSKMNRIRPNGAEATNYGMSANMKKKKMLSGSKINDMKFL